MPNSEKEIVYNILKRYIDNLCSKTPLFWTFKDLIFQHLVNYIDPYLNIFIEDGTLDIDMTTDFAAKELDQKLREFKQAYKTAHENKDNI